MNDDLEIGESREWKAEQLRYIQPCHKCKIKPILSYVDAAHCIGDHLPHYVVKCPLCGYKIRTDDPVGSWNIIQYWKAERNGGNDQ